MRTIRWSFVYIFIALVLFLIPVMGSDIIKVGTLDLNASVATQIGNGTHIFFYIASATGRVGINTTSPTGVLQVNVNGSDVFHINETGNIGLNIVNPQFMLEVNGTSRFDANQTWLIPSGDGQVCFERFIGTQFNYTRCVNSTGQITERVGTFTV